MELVFSPLTAATLVSMVVMALAAAWRPTKTPKNLNARLSSFARREAEAKEPEDGVIEGSLLERVVEPVLRRMLQSLGRLSPSKATEELNQRLTLAGRPGKLSATDFLGLRILLAAGGFGLGILAGRLGGSPQLGLLAPIFGVLVGYQAPFYWLRSRIRSRKDLIQRALPDALDMLTICVEAGLAFESSMQRVSSQWKGPLSDEFARVVAEIRLGVPRPQALRRFSGRCGVDDVTSFVAVLVQADSMGTSVSQVLHSQSEQMRVLRRQRAEEKANKAPIKIIMAMLMFIFPALFVIILGPAVPRIIEAFSGMGGG